MNPISPPPTAAPRPDAAAILQAHQLYCQLTGQSLRLAFDRERQWFELLRVGFSLDDLRTVITYLQREIRHGRRYVGALKLSNLLQPDRFEEDLQISRLALRSPPTSPAPPPAPAPDPIDRERGRQRALAFLHGLKANLR